MLRRFRYIYKLFLAFLLTGIIPVALLSSSFALLSDGIMKGSYKQQAQLAIKGISSDLDNLFEEYSHRVYALSVDEDIINAILQDSNPPRSERLNLYKKIYTALSGHIDHASLHIISMTGFPSLSSQQVPSSYLDTDSDAAGGIFILARSQPEKTWAVFNSYVTGRGDPVFLTICRAIRDERANIIGFVLLDVNKSHIATLSEDQNHDVFSQLLIVDPKNNVVSDLRHSENDGDFSRLPFLSEIRTNTSGEYTADERMIIHTPLELQPFQIAGTVPIKVILSNLDYLVRITLWMLLFCTALAVILAILVSRSISKPVHSLTLAMGQVEEGDLSVRIPLERHDEIGLLFKRFNIMTGRIENLVTETKEEQAQLRIAERKALQAQINPHFLYNTLNTIKSIAKLQGIDQITTIVTQLGKLLRNTIDNEKEMVSLAESLELLESYLAIQKIRFGQRLSYSIEAPENILLQKVPKLILQPIVENAVIHGLEQKTEAGKVTVKASEKENMLNIEISDNGLGMDIPWVPGEHSGPHGVGLNNIRRRLILIYGESAGLDISSRADEGTQVIVTIPMNTKGEK